MDKLDNCAWLMGDNVQAAFDILEQEGDTARAVGGTVRNALLGVPVADIDIACTALPQQTLARAQAAGVKAIATGIDHGTVTLVIGGTPIEVTSLREDVETNGRHAVVRFGRDWVRDAQRRDFTMNALYVDRHGVLFDPLGGLDDCLARRLRFIGDAGARIREDYLRILRYFRFFARFAVGAPDEAAMAAIGAHYGGLAQISEERITRELLLMLEANGAVEALALMQETNVLELIMGQHVAVERCGDFLQMAAKTNCGQSRGLGAVAALLMNGVLQDRRQALAKSKLRLSNAQTLQVQQSMELAGYFEDGLPVAQNVRAALLDYKRAAVADGLLLGVVFAGKTGLQGEGEFAHLEELLALCWQWDVPVMPLCGKDLIDCGVQGGAVMGQALAAAKAQWIASDFQLERPVLLKIAMDYIAEQVAEAQSPTIEDSERRA
ncbi:CCA tRNA nucleotidyltransferase [Polycladidibacter stylochi]|uniref:CCA tRNA nucleotidyltransferase n=1 Tax=Polycladidibacter stylochi TaxID=1807766 RepID=UPI0009EC6733|nr:CCA tRNA nucleotidyltransferase [Pseudovibrio stylochi]